MVPVVAQLLNVRKIEAFGVLGGKGSVWGFIENWHSMRPMWDAKRCANGRKGREKVQNGGAQAS